MVIKVGSGLREHASTSSGCIGKFTQPTLSLFTNPVINAGILYVLYFVFRMISMGNGHRNSSQNASPNDGDDDKEITFSSPLAERLSPDPTWTSRRPPTSDSNMATGDNEIVAEARSQWRSFAIESAVRNQLLEEGEKREEVDEHVGELLRDDRFMATFSKVSLKILFILLECRFRTEVRIRTFFGFERLCWPNAINRTLPG